MITYADDRPTEPAAATVDVRVERSRAVLVDAMLRQLRRNPDGKISVSELCKEAGVSRPTFYQHFETLDDLLAAAVRRRMHEVSTHARERQEGTGQTRATVIALFEEIDQDRAIYRGLLGHHASYGGSRRMLEDWLMSQLAEHVVDGTSAEPGSSTDVRLQVLAGGALSAIGRWLEAPQDPDPGAAAALGAELWQTIEQLLAPGAPAAPRLDPTASGGSTPLPG